MTRPAAEGASPRDGAPVAPLRRPFHGQLSVVEARAALGADGIALSDDDVDRLRVALAPLVNVVIEEYRERKRKGLAARFDRVLALVPDGDRDGVEERAAIMEFDGNKPREHAEHRAIVRYLNQAGVVVDEDDRSSEE